MIEENKEKVLKRCDLVLRYLSRNKETFSKYLFINYNVGMDENYQPVLDTIMPVSLYDYISYNLHRFVDCCNGRNIKPKFIGNGELFITDMIHVLMCMKRLYKLGYYENGYTEGEYKLVYTGGIIIEDADHKIHASKDFTQSSPCTTKTALYFKEDRSKFKFLLTNLVGIYNYVEQ